MAATPPPPAFGTQAPPFNLPGTDGRNYTFRDVAGKNGTVIVFICNHCPYVKAVIDRLSADARTLMSEGIGFAAICSNDASHPSRRLLRQYEEVCRCPSLALSLSTRRNPDRRAGV